MGAIDEPGRGGIHEPVVEVFARVGLGLGGHCHWTGRSVDHLAGQASRRLDGRHRTSHLKVACSSSARTRRARPSRRPRQLPVRLCQDSDFRGHVHRDVSRCIFSLRTICPRIERGALDPSPKERPAEAGRGARVPCSRSAASNRANSIWMAPARVSSSRNNHPVLARVASKNARQANYGAGNTWFQPVGPGSEPGDFR